MNNLQSITLYKLHNKLSRTCKARRVEPVELDVSSQSSSTCRLSRTSRVRRVEPVERVELVVSRESSCAVRLARHSQNAWTRHVERVESSQVEFGLIRGSIWYTAEMYIYVCEASRLCPVSFSCRPHCTRLDIPSHPIRPIQVRSQ